jgi:hydrogenase maturation factor
VTPRLAAILEFHAASEALQKCHAALTDGGHTEIAERVRDASVMVTTALGKLIVAEAAARRLVSV